MTLQITAFAVWRRAPFCIMQHTRNLNPVALRHRNASHRLQDARRVGSACRASGFGTAAEFVVTNCIGGTTERVANYSFGLPPILPASSRLFQLKRAAAHGTCLCHVPYFCRRCCGAAVGRLLSGQNAEIPGWASEPSVLDDGRLATAAAPLGGAAAAEAVPPPAEDMAISREASPVSSTLGEEATITHCRRARRLLEAQQWSW